MFEAIGYHAEQGLHFAYKAILYVAKHVYTNKKSALFRASAMYKVRLCNLRTSVQWIALMPATYQI